MAYGNGGGLQPSGYTVSANPTAPPPVRPVIQQGLDSQEQALGNLHAVIDELEKKLSLITDPVGPEVNGNSPTPASSQIGERIQRHYNGIEAASSRLQRLIGRVQL